MRYLACIHFIDGLLEFASISFPTVQIFAIYSLNIKGSRQIYPSAQIQQQSLPGFLLKAPFCSRLSKPFNAP
jgi:hypothetical protein